MENIRVLSMNVHYKSMQTNPLHPSCQLTSYGNSTCLENVTRFINENAPYHFICLQEATNWEKLLSESPILQSMNCYHYKPALDQIVVFSNPRYQLSDRLDGWMADPNRPFVILFFNSNLCLISLHAGHKYDIYHLDSYIKRVLESEPNKKQNRLQMLTNFDLVIAGDFNLELKSGLKILGRKLYGFNQTPSCCDSKLRPERMRSAFDHVLTTFPDNQSLVYPLAFASDHLPIIARLKRKISKRIGYDFDGVLHREVSETDWEGQRHPSRLHGPYEALDIVINQIKTDLENGHQVYIVTARSKTPISVKSIRDHLYFYLGLMANNIPIYWTAGTDKSDVVRKLDLDSFYDDSILRIDQLIKSKMKGKLPSLKYVYLVDPIGKKFGRLDLDKIKN